MVTIGPVVPEKKTITFSRCNCRFFCYYPPLEKGMIFYLNKREPPLPKNPLCQVWLIFKKTIVHLCHIILSLYC